MSICIEALTARDSITATTTFDEAIAQDITASDYAEQEIEIAEYVTQTITWEDSV